MRFLRHFIFTATILLSIVLAPPTSAVPSALSGQTVYPNNADNNEQQPLSHEQIQRFVTAIAIIKHYYIKPTTDAELFDNAIKGMVSMLDPHSSFLDADDLRDLKAAITGEFVGIGVELTSEDGVLRVVAPLEGTPADRAGIKPNDLIIKIDDKLVQNMTITEAINLIKGKQGTKVNLMIIRKSLKQPLQLAIPRSVVKLVTFKDKIMDDHYAYIRISSFDGPAEQNLYKATAQLKAQYALHGAILDLRNNPGGLLEVGAKVAGAFLDASKLNRYGNVIVYTKGRIPDSDLVLRAKSGDIINGLPLVVLINGGSASASEVVAGALQDYHRAIIMGTTSFGKGSVQTLIPLDADSAMKLTTALYYTPAGRVIQAKGIRPDVVVPELTVSNANTSNLLNLDEENYGNHLSGIVSEVTPAEIAKMKAIATADAALAKTDYQLYEALMMLKGLSALQNKPILSNSH